MATMENLALRMRLYAENVRENSNEIKRIGAIAILADVVPATPVDEGVARGGWEVENTTIGGNARVPRRESGNADKSGGSTISKGVSTIRQSDSGERINIYNNVRYIGRLDRGHSAQATAGFIRRSVRRGRIAIARRLERILSRTV